VLKNKNNFWYSIFVAQMTINHTCINEKSLNIDYNKSYYKSQFYNPLYHHLYIILTQTTAISRVRYNYLPILHNIIFIILLLTFRRA